MKQLQLTSASQASESTIDMAGKDYNGKRNDGHSRRYEGSNVVKPELEFRPTKNRHRYYPFIEVNIFFSQDNAVHKKSFEN